MDNKVSISISDCEAMDSDNHVCDMKCPALNWTVSELCLQIPSSNNTANEYLHISMKCRITCQEKYYGTNCSTYCKPITNITGLYECDDKGILQEVKQLHTSTTIIQGI